MDGVIKYGSGKADWNTARSAIMPVTELAVALNGEASFAIVCRMQSDEFVVGGDFVKHERALALKIARGDDKTFTTEATTVKLIAIGNSMVATTARFGTQAVLDNTGESTRFKRASIAKESGVAIIVFVPRAGGVLEYSMPKAGSVALSSLLHLVATQEVPQDHINRRLWMNLSHLLRL